MVSSIVFALAVTISLIITIYIGPDQVCTITAIAISYVVDVWDVEIQ